MAPGERKPVLFAPLSRFMRNKIAVKMFRTVSIRITRIASDGVHSCKTEKLGKLKRGQEEEEKVAEKVEEKEEEAKEKRII